MDEMSDDIRYLEFLSWVVWVRLDAISRTSWIGLQPEPTELAEEEVDLVLVRVFTDNALNIKHTQVQNKKNKQKQYLLNYQVTRHFNYVINFSNVKT